MEEADLLKERLQAITDKRRIQEDIAKKRRQIEEEKLKLQYIKKKSLREQWLMEGLTQQSQEEQEAMKLQALDEQHRSDELQSNIDRIEKEIEVLETEELKISANEESVLRRLKEVEKTAEDIIKELNAELQTDMIHHAPSLPPELSFHIQPAPAHRPSFPEAVQEEAKKATFAVEISVERDMRTGKSQVVSTATVTPERIQERGGVKVYDDGRKSVYALSSGGHGTASVPAAAADMTPTEVDELLRQATDTKVPSEVQFHQPVFSTPYAGTSRSSTPRTPRQALTPCASPFPAQTPSWNQAHILGDGVCGQETEVGTTGSWPDLPGRGGGPDIRGSGSTTLVPVRSRCEGMLTPVQPLCLNLDGHSPTHSRYSPLYPEGSASPNLANTPFTDLETEPVTMIFMGYQNAEDDEDEDFQAELVIIGDSDDEGEDEDGGGEKGEEFVSYHPEGYKSKVFQPEVGVATVTSRRDLIEDANQDGVLLPKPTFIHKPGKNSPGLQGHGMDESTSNLEEMKLCTTGR